MALEGDAFGNAFGDAAPIRASSIPTRNDGNFPASSTFTARLNVGALAVVLVRRMRRLDGVEEFRRMRPTVTPPRIGSAKVLPPGDFGVSGSPPPPLPPPAPLAIIILGDGLREVIDARRRTRPVPPLSIDGESHSRCLFVCVCVCVCVL